MRSPPEPMPIAVLMPQPPEAIDDILSGLDPDVIPNMGVEPASD